MLILGVYFFMLGFLWRWSLILEACLDQVETSFHLSLKDRVTTRDQEGLGSQDRKLFQGPSLFSSSLRGFTVSFFLFNCIIFILNQIDFLYLFSAPALYWVLLKVPIRDIWYQLFPLLNSQERGYISLNLGHVSLGQLRLEDKITLYDMTVKD